MRGILVLDKVGLHRSLSFFRRFARVECSDSFQNKRDCSDLCFELYFPQ